MGGIFGAVSKEDITAALFFGTDYHTHLGARRGGMAVYAPETGFQRAIHNIENAPFRTKFGDDMDDIDGDEQSDHRAVEPIQDPYHALGPPVAVIGKHGHIVQIDAADGRVVVRLAGILIADLNRLFSIRSKISSAGMGLQ